MNGNERVASHVFQTHRGFAVHTETFGASEIHGPLLTTTIGEWGFEYCPT